MEPHADALDMPAVPAATVVLLREGPGGLEVFLLKRHASSGEGLAGAHVFPGGKVDREDIELVPRLDLPLGQLQALLGEPQLSPEAAGAFFVAAIREVFEETGLLFAPVTGAQAQGAWRSLREGLHFDEVVQALDVPLQASALVPWSRWVTPSLGGVMRKRFDARFFVAGVPAGQQPTHDGREATASAWLTPAQALAQYWSLQVQFAPPQILSLAHLARLPDLATVLRDARSRLPPLVAPQPLQVEGTRVICYPGDPLHPERRQAVPGPTRLAWRNGRFEPDGGFDALLR